MIEDWTPTAGERERPTHLWKVLFPGHKDDDWLGTQPKRKQPKRKVKVKVPHEDE